MSDNTEYNYSRFVVFCLEAYKRNKSLSGAEAFSLFDRYNITDYLVDGYDVLHSLGEVALVSDISDFIAKRTKGTRGGPPAA